jgi:hypothetical protein
VTEALLSTSFDHKSESFGTKSNVGLRGQMLAPGRHFYVGGGWTIILLENGKVLPALSSGRSSMEVKV